ncbi:hypothetical protein EM20IM_08350 [Candidatus Methylacidiphilum infernorum]|uniref:Uncharacterized protein n=1 Tax=Candidatus Methylacidiphilum infernorum TaxID=511746 RepID=A0ABX7PU32_9BACT|nr:hypothetical protein [Candidatus Methylacidiphilum infernorum]QSR86494.1 hypothetical protein EM20IM_08350 [Candidatus Methylacidiphilum infernorum]
MDLMGKESTEDASGMDRWNEILLKAQFGQRLSDAELSQISEVDLGTLLKLKEGILHEKALIAVARALSLSGEILLLMARDNFIPQAFPLPPFLKRVPSRRFPGKNSYVLLDQQSQKSLLVDPQDMDLLLAYIQDQSYGVQEVFFCSPKEMKEMAEVLSNFSVPYSGPSLREDLPPFSEPRVEKKVLEKGSFKIEAIQVENPSPKILYFIWSQQPPPLVFVGNFFISGSIFLEEVDYFQMLELLRRTVLSLPEETIICPARGPLTTVGFEKGHNPFFPEYQIFSSFESLTEM